MKYTVVWMPAAEHKLAELWMDASNRSEVTFAANKIDAQLAGDPLQAGEQREGIFRILIESPLAVYYFVNAHDRIVRVLTVHRFC